MTKFKFTEYTQNLRSKNLLRFLRPIDSCQGTRVTYQDDVYLNFSSNDYLGLAYDVRVMGAAKEAIDKWGTGSGSSRLVTGSLGIHHQLEEKVAQFKHKESSLIFSSGFQTNIGVIQGLLNPEDVIIVDRQCHASLVDGARLSGAKLKVYPHNDMQSLITILKKYKSVNVLVITDTYFSMDGDKAPLKELSAICKEFGAMILADEAHAIGVFGGKGEGLIDSNLAKDIDLITGTFSKSMGSQGGFVACDHHIREVLINRARSFIYSTAPAPTMSAAAIKSIEIIMTETIIKEKLWSNIKSLRDGIDKLGLDTMKSSGPIIPILIEDTERCLDISNRLLELKVLVPAIRPPTVKQGTDRLRVSVTAKHNESDIKELLLKLKKCI